MEERPEASLAEATKQQIADAKEEKDKQMTVE